MGSPGGKEGLHCHHVISANEKLQDTPSMRKDRRGDNLRWVGKFNHGQLQMDYFSFHTYSFTTFLYKLTREREREKYERKGSEE